MLSTTYDDFKSVVQDKLNGLTVLQKIHTLLRLNEKLRLIHNAVGSCGKWSWIDNDQVIRYKNPTTTIQEFHVLYPSVFDRIKGELQPYIEDDVYLSKKGWEFFLKNMWDPRHDVAIGILNTVKGLLREASASFEVTAF